MFWGALVSYVAGKQRLTLPQVVGVSRSTMKHKPAKKVAAALAR